MKSDWFLTLPTFALVACIPKAALERQILTYIGLLLRDRFHGEVSAGGAVGMRPTGVGQNSP